MIQPHTLPANIPLSLFCCESSQYGECETSYYTRDGEVEGLLGHRCVWCEQPMCRVDGCRNRAMDECQGEVMCVEHEAEDSREFVRREIQAELDGRARMELDLVLSSMWRVYECYGVDLGKVVENEDGVKLRRN